VLVALLVAHLLLRDFGPYGIIFMIICIYHQSRRAIYLIHKTLIYSLLGRIMLMGVSILLGPSERASLDHWTGSPLFYLRTEIDPVSEICAFRNMRRWTKSKRTSLPSAVTHHRQSPLELIQSSCLPFVVCPFQCDTHSLNLLVFKLNWLQLSTYTPTSI
jgi:hypothetical protein